MVCFFFFECYCDHRDLHVLTHSFPTRRSSDLVSLTPPSSLCALRNASSSVMSASSVCVTCGTFSHARCRCAADSLRIRASGRVSISPNCAKSTAGMVGIPPPDIRSEEHTSDLQSLLRSPYAFFCLQK